MKRHLIALVLLFGSVAHATTYYFANAGSDSAACTLAAPCQTAGKANSLASTSINTTFLFNGGDFFRDTYLMCGSQYQNTGAATTTTNPPICRGNTFGSYGTGQAIVDAADPICAGAWSLVLGQTSTYQCTLPSGSAIPQKLYVDPTYTVYNRNPVTGGPLAGSSILQQQLLPVPNYVGPSGSCTGTANFLDAYGQYYNGQGEGYLLMNMQPAQVACINSGGGSNLTATNPLDPQTAMQGFTTELSGLANVEKGAAYFAPQVPCFGYPKYPGAWYVSGNCPTQACTVYVNLADGTNPNSHVIEATHRPYNVLIEGTNNVTVQNIIGAHAEQSGVLVQPYSLTDSVANDITVQGSTFFNCASNMQDPIAQSSGPDGNSPNGGTGNNLNGCIVFQPSAALTPLLLRHPRVLNDKVGTVDTYFSSAGSGLTAGIYVSSGDGGGVENDCVECRNIIATTNTIGAAYATGRVSLKFGTIEQNNGGRVSSNICTQSQDCFNFSGVNGGMFDHNFAYDAYGEAFQMGGSSTSVEGGPSGPVAGSQVWLANRAANIGLDATFLLYNGFDCNTNSTAFSGFYAIGNSIFNVYAAGMTFEQASIGNVQNPNVGCLNPHLINNLIDNNAIMFGNGNSSVPDLSNPACLTSPVGPTCDYVHNPNWKSQADSLPNQSQIYYINTSMPPSTYDFQHNWYLQSPGVTDVGSYGRTCAVMLQDFNDTTDACYGADPQFINALPGYDNLMLQPTSPLIGAGKPGFNNGNIGVYFTNSPLGYKSAILNGSIQ